MIMFTNRLEFVWTWIQRKFIFSKISLGTVQKLQVGVFSSGPLLRVGGWVQVALLKLKKRTEVRTRSAAN